VITMTRRLVPFALLAILSVSACGEDSSSAVDGQAQGQDSPAAAPIEVATSTDVYGAVVQAVGEDRVTVTSFIDSPGADPEAYEATPADAAAVQAAQLVIGNGGGYDDFIFQLVDASGGERTVVDVAEFSELEAEVAEGEEFNEHIWFKLTSMQELAVRIADDLGELSPDDAETFTANAEAFGAEVQELIDKVAEIESEYAGVRVAATEPLPLYLLADAGLENATPEEFLEASEEGTDAPAAVVQEALELVTGPDPIRVLLLNTQTQTPATDRLREAAEEAGIPEVEVNETLSAEFDQYVPWIGAQIDALAEALEQTA